MLSNSHDVAPVAGPSRRTSRATRLIQAAALAAVLVPLGTVAVETASIQCVTTMSGGGSCAPGFYYGGGGDQTNTWEFYRDASYSQLIYVLKIAGNPAADFSLNVTDYVWYYGGGGPSPGPEQWYSTWQCVPLFTLYSYGSCAAFHVSVASPNPPPGPLFNDQYTLTIKWIANTDPLSDPGAMGDVTILRNEGGPSDPYGNPLTIVAYDSGPGIPNTDPGISGRGDGFSWFTVFTNPEPTPVPEPASLILVGSGVAGVLYRARRRRRQP